MSTDQVTLQEAQPSYLPSPEKVSHLKAVHGQLVLVELPENNGSPALAFVLKKPDMNILKAVAAVGAKDPMAGAQTLVKSCTVWATDEAQLENVSVFLAVSKAAEKLAEERTATVKNL